MDWKTFTIELLSAIAWPIAVALILVLFRGAILDLLAKVRSIKHKDTEILLEQFLQKPLSHKEDGGEFVDSPERSHGEDYKGFLLRLAESAPNLAILEAWNIVRNEAQSAMSRSSDANAHRTPTLDDWVSEALVSSELMEKYRRLGTVRNIISHGRDLKLTKAAAQSYILMSISVAYALRNYGRP